MRQIFLGLALLICTATINSQELELKWSEKFQYDNKLDGFFDYFLGTNKQYIYAKFSNLSITGKNSNEKIKILAFDKNTMQKVGEVQLVGYSKDKEKKSMEYYQSIILENVLYIIWTKQSNKVVEIYAESFDNKLRKLQGLKKVYEINVSKKATDNLIIVYNNTLGNKILLGKEFAVTHDDENLRFEYKIINEDFSLSSSNQVTLPVIVAKKRRRDDSFTNLVCSYEFANDGKIYVEDMIRMSEEERKGLKKWEASVYPIIMQITPESGALKTFSVKFQKKNTFNYSSLISKNGVKLYGFFSDLEKDPKGNDTHGLFYLTLDSKDFTLEDSRFSYFDKDFLNQLYAADKENQKKGTGLFKSKGAKASDEESIDDNYIIEKVEEDGKDILLFCTIMRNWSRQVCTPTSNGMQSCRTYYYCTKSNVTAFRLSGSGNILWAKNLDRSITYPRWDVYDLNVVRKNDTYYVVYGSAFQMNATKKNRRNKKSAKQLTDRLEYATFNARTGDYKKAEYQVNRLNVKKADMKYVASEDIEVFDNKMYTECRKVKYKPTTWLACLCPPVFYFLNFSGNSRRGHGHLGMLSPVN